MKKSLSTIVLLKSLEIAKLLNKLFFSRLRVNYDVILCYHDISKDTWEFSITKEEFDKQMKMLFKKFSVVSLEEIINTKNGTGSPRVAITFDDGYQGVYKHAFPILQKYGLTASVFILGSKDANPKGKVKSKLLTANEIQKLSAAGWNIGYHTDSHPNLVSLNTNELAAEVSDGVTKLEESLGISLKYFAYPFGIYNSKVTQKVKSAGFLGAFTTDGSIVNKSNKFAISRVTVSKYITTKNLENLVTYLGIIFNSFIVKILQIKDRIFKKKKDKLNRKRLIISTYDDIKNPHYAGGGAIAIHELAKRLKDEYDLQIISWNHTGRSQETIDGVNYKRVGYPNINPKVAMCLFQIFLPLYSYTQKFDVWFESFGPPFTTSFMPLFRRKNVVGIVHMLAAEDMQRKYNLPIFSIMEKLGIRTYKHIITTSEPIKEKVRLLNPTADIAVISNGIESVQKPVETKDNNVILFLGRIEVDQKGLDLLIKSFEQVGKEYRLVIAGSGTSEEIIKLKRLIRKSNIKKQIFYIGKVSGKRKDRLFRKSVCVVIPSRFETFSVVALEAMAFGLPVVSFRIGGLKWAPANAIRKVEPFKTDELAKEIINLLQNSTTRTEMGKVGREYAKKYTWDAIADSYKGFVGKILI